jgi:CubicO group peptidase (beta-lactamase class C family)
LFLFLISGRVPTTEASTPIIRHRDLTTQIVLLLRQQDNNLTMQGAIPMLGISRLLTVVFTFVLMPSLASAATSEALSEVRDFLEQTYSPDRPGASVVIMEKGEIVHQQGYGLANVELGVPISPDTIFRVGSVTKQFTAAAIMLLQQRGELSVNDPIGKFLPDYPTHGHQITIEHLLTHTSGIMSYTNIPGYMDQEIRRDLTTEELIEVFENQPMEFAPGDKWNYNNSGYVLLGAIIEAVSGQSYEDFIAENIAGPLDLESTLYGGPKLIPNRASGYGTDDEGNIVNADFLSMTQPHAAGSLLSTTGDLVDWHKALTGGEFIHDESYELMTTPVGLNDDESYPYGFGLGISELRGQRLIHHGGGIHGFSCYSLWLPDQDVYVAVLTNGATEGPGATTVAKMIAAMTIGDPYPDREAIDLSDQDLQGLAGKFVGENFPPIEVTVEEKSITFDIGGFSTETVYAESRDVLFMHDSLNHVEVEWDGDKASRLLLHRDEGVPPEILQRQTE